MVKLNIQNDIGMRNIFAEDKLMKIGTKYHKKMWAQVPIPKTMVTQSMKKASSQIQTQEEEIRENSILQHLNRPRQLQNKISCCLTFNTEININELSECNDDSPKTGAPRNDLEEVLYSEGEGVTELYPGNTWDSEDDICGDYYLLTSEWM